MTQTHGVVALTTYRVIVALCSERPALLTVPRIRTSSSSAQPRESSLQGRKRMKVPYDGDTVHSTKNSLQGIVLTITSYSIDSLTQSQLQRDRFVSNHRCTHSAFIVRSHDHQICFLSASFLMRASTHA